VKLAHSVETIIDNDDDGGGLSVYNSERQFNVGFITPETDSRRNTCSGADMSCLRLHTTNIWNTRRTQEGCEDGV